MSQFTEARVLADSINPRGVRLTTYWVKFPRIVLAQLNTHRVLSRSMMSLRAIPTATLLEKLRQEYFIPDSFGRNQKGMVAADRLFGQDADNARRIWINALEQAKLQAGMLSGLQVHKEHANRLLEPFVYCEGIVSGTEWTNFFILRDIGSEAQPELSVLAEKIRLARSQSNPVFLSPGQWHIPAFPGESAVCALCSDTGSQPGDLPCTCGVNRIRLSIPVFVPRSALAAVGRCARASYARQNQEHTAESDLALHDKLLRSRHMSPFEHVARAENDVDYRGNFAGFTQYRKMIPGESGSRIVDLGSTNHKGE